MDFLPQIYLILFDSSRMENYTVTDLTYLEAMAELRQCQPEAQHG